MKIKKQQHIRDCGVSVIQALCAFFHKEWVHEHELKLNVNYGKNGISAQNLINLGKNYGIKLTPYEVTMIDLKQSKIKDYMIALIKHNAQAHYVIIKLQTHFVIMFDPMNGKQKISYEIFNNYFINLIFLLEKIPFNKKLITSFNVWHLVWKKSSIMLVICLLMIINLILMLLSSFFLKIILDKIIPGHLTNTLLIIVISFSFIAILRVSFNFIQNYLCQKIMVYCKLTLYEIYYEKLNNAPLQELNKLTASEHLKRLRLITEVSVFVANCYKLIFEHNLLLITSSAILISLSTKMLAIALLLGFIIIIFMCGFQMKIRLMSDDLIAHEIHEFNAQTDLVMSLSELKNIDFQNFLMNKLHKNKFLNHNHQFNMWKILTLQNIINELIALIGPIILAFIATHLIFANKISLGTMLFFLSIFHYFLEALKNLVSFVANFSYNYKNINLLKFCLNLNDEKLIAQKKSWQETNLLPNQNLEIQKINNIKAKEMIFSYDKPFFKIKDWQINQNIHLIGANGTGKTTLLKLISGCYFADKSLLINNYPLNSYSLSSYRQKVFFANPNIYLPNCTMIEYITLNDKNAIKDFTNNCNRFNLLILFNKIGLNLTMTITNNGQNLSAGQKQLIILLRLLAFRFDVILNDEGLENIDEETVLILKTAINNFQTAIFIEVSHGQKYLSMGKEVIIDEIITYFP